MDEWICGSWKMPKYSRMNGCNDCRSSVLMGCVAERACIQVYLCSQVHAATVYRSFPLVYLPFSTVARIGSCVGLLCSHRPTILIMIHPGGSMNVMLCYTCMDVCISPLAEGYSEALSA